MQMMRANVFHGPDNIALEEVPRPSTAAGEALIKITLTTICGTDIHILRGEYAVPIWIARCSDKRQIGCVLLPMKM